MRYRIIYDRTRRNYAGYAPDLPVCTAAADTLDECRVLMRQGIRYLLEALAEDGDIRPKPTGYIEILKFPPRPVRPARASSAVKRERRGQPKPSKKAVAREGFARPSRPGPLEAKQTKSAKRRGFIRTG